MEINKSVLCVFFWRQIKFFSLVMNMFASDVLYTEWVLCIGNGTEQKLIEIPQQCIYTKEEMMDHLFGDELPLYPHRLEEYKNFILKRVVLAPTNKDFHQLNEEILKTMTSMEIPILIFRWNI